jgi:hypothetical protein
VIDATDRLTIRPVRMNSCSVKIGVVGITGRASGTRCVSESASTLDPSASIKSSTCRADRRPNSTPVHKEFNLVELEFLWKHLVEGAKP